MPMVNGGLLNIGRATGDFNITIDTGLRLKILLLDD